MDWLKQLQACQDKEQVAHILSELQQEVNDAFSNVVEELLKSSRSLDRKVLHSLETLAFRGAYILAVSELFEVIGHRE